MKFISLKTSIQQQKEWISNYSLLTRYDETFSWNFFMWELSKNVNSFQLIVLFTRENNSELSDEVLCQVLSDLYFNAPIKHPLRSILSK